MCSEWVVACIAGYLDCIGNGYDWAHHRVCHNSSHSVFLSFTKAIGLAPIK